MCIKVLAIDDSRTIRNLLRRTFEEANCDISFAEDGEKGLLVFEKSDPDVVITDINMPNMNGFDFIINARNLKRRRIVPILVLSTETHEDLRKKARKAGATGWLVKPFDEENIVRVVKKVTGKLEGIK